MLKLSISLLSIIFLINFSVKADSEIFNPEVIINNITAKNQTWKAKKNARFNNTTLKKIKRQMGVNGKYFKKKNKTKQKRSLTTLDATMIKNFPVNFDLREHYPECVSIRTVDDQSSCGCCWAFSAVQSINDRFCILSKGRNQPILSVKNVLSCCRYCGDGCSGGTPSLAFDFIMRTGIPTGSGYISQGTCQAYPFPKCDHHVDGTYGKCDEADPPTPNCSNKCDDGTDINEKGKHYILNNGFEVQDDEFSIMAEIFHFGSVQMSVEIYEDFLLYSSGVYKYTTGNFVGYHAMRCIGWGVENGVKYWLVVNSWNNEWGDNGIVKILRGEDEIGIESNVLAGMPVLKDIPIMI